MDTHSNLLRMSRLDYYLVLKLLNFVLQDMVLMVGSAKDLKCAINEKCPELCHSVAKTLYNPCKRQHLPLLTTIKKIQYSLLPIQQHLLFFFLLMIQFKRFLRFLFRYIEYRVPLAGVAKLALISTICHSDRNKRLTQLGVVGGNPKKELLLFQNNRSRLS